MTVMILGKPISTPCCFGYKLHGNVYFKKSIHRLVLSKMFPIGDQGPLTSQSNRIEQSKKNSEDATVCKSQKLMLQKKLILGASAGTFYMLPWITRSLGKLHRLIDQEMYSIGAQKVTLPCLASKNLWMSTDRWNKMGSELFTLTDRADAEYCLSPTHEEAVTSVVAAESPLSYKRLPVRLYQIGRKYRDERRPKHGLLRCREFEMKDLYTFDADQRSAEITYEEVCTAYSRLLSRLGLPFVRVEASSGAMGGVKSQEFDLLSPVGEDTLYTCGQCGKTFNKEIISDQPISCVEKNCAKDFQIRTGIEVAHAFVLGTSYSETLKALYIDQHQQKHPLYMDCFGIGVTRLLAAAIEILSTDDELRWPSLLAPYQVCIVPQKEGFKSELTSALAESLYDELTSRCDKLRYEIVIDDRLHLSIGQRVKQAKASGYPNIVALGKQALLDNALFEHIDVYGNTVEHVGRSQLLDKLTTLPVVQLV